MQILHFEDLGETECHLAANFNSNVAQGGIYPHIKFRSDLLNIFQVKSVNVVRVYGRTRC